MKLTDMKSAVTVASFMFLEDTRAMDVHKGSSNSCKMVSVTLCFVVFLFFFNDASKNESFKIGRFPWMMATVLERRFHPGIQKVL